MIAKQKQICQDHKLFIQLLSVLAVFRFIYVSIIPILPQEAYYWYYSLKPALSYYDHPPMAAYSIWLGTRLFGDSIFGVKFMAVVWSLLTNLILYLTALQIFQELNANLRRYWSLAVVGLYNLTLFAHIYAVIIVPDTPLMFFWALVIFMVLKFQHSARVKYLYYAGIALGLGMLSKYTAVAILPAVFLILITDVQSRRVLRTVHPYLSLLTAVLIFMPVVVWNMQNHWASFGFQFSGRAESLKTFQSKYILQLIASQIFILTPMPVVLFFRTTWLVLRDWREKITARNLLITGSFIIGGFILVSLRSLVKMNWLMPGYLGLILATILLIQDRDILKSVWIKTGIALSVILIITAHLVLLIPNIPLGEGNTWSGWQDASQKIHQLQKKMGGRDTVFLFTNSYKAASLIKFYLPDEQEVYAQNIFGQDALQFDIWGIPDSLHGKDALYIFSDRYEYKSQLDEVAKYFDRLTPLMEFRYIFGDNKTTRIISCYLAKDYRPDMAYKNNNKSVPSHDRRAKIEQTGGVTFQ
jgi:hypothetical protein